MNRLRQLHTTGLGHPWKLWALRHELFEIVEGYDEAIRWLSVSSLPVGGDTVIRDAERRFASLNRRMDEEGL